MPSRFQQVTFIIAIFFATFFTTRLVLPTSAESQSPKTPKFGIFYPPTIAPTPTNTPTPSSSQPPVFIPTSIPLLPQRSGFFPYSQRDPRWRSYPDPDGNNLGYCGCGETSVAMILTDYFDRSFTPDLGDYSPSRLWDYYRNARLGTCGTNIEWHKQVLENYGLKVSKVYGYDSFASPKAFANYLASGYKTLLYYDRPWNDIGHYVLVADVVGSQLIVYDPYLLSGRSQPVYIEPGVTPRLYITIIM